MPHPQTIVQDRLWTFRLGTDRVAVESFQFTTRSAADVWSISNSSTVHADHQEVPADGTTQIFYEQPLVSSD